MRVTSLDGRSIITSLNDLTPGQCFIPLTTGECGLCLDGGYIVFLTNNNVEFPTLSAIKVREWRIRGQYLIVPGFEIRT